MVLKIHPNIHAVAKCKGWPTVVGHPKYAFGMSAELRNVHLASQPAYLASRLTSLAYCPMGSGVTSLAYCPIGSGVTSLAYCPIGSGVTSLAYCPIGSGVTSLTYCPIGSGVTSLAHLDGLETCEGIQLLMKKCKLLSQGGPEGR